MLLPPFGSSQLAYASMPSVLSVADDAHESGLCRKPTHANCFTELTHTSKPVRHNTPIELIVHRLTRLGLGDVARVFQC